MDKTVRSVRWPLVFDFAERIVLIALYVSLVMRILAVVQHNPYNVVLLLSEAIVLGLLLVRRPADQLSLRPLDWIIAFGGTAAPMLAAPADGALIPQFTGLVVMIYGLVVSMAAQIALRRSFGVVAANRGVRIGGPYRFVRHPMYVGYFIINAGFLLLNPSAWNLAMFGVGAALQVMRILAEERVLGEDPAYRAYAASVPYRLVPKLF
ncbi:isoprenylcysteine carboxylmethyltransferase family protein [Caulobacter sp. 17J80-11]|uniref:methyltransferase family protein n=1 Tax=Caulobacter sp. 17J80-11 TaxID=2763502 RepID=UPI0016538279|nr:isoprenylcysteine carboxylmethyltransferase family protein [Caulobacter sp. 17J80-11]MBC6981582.1 isoprenylcysteine carboxylmethyltransferase family protein [Caulobacter sp. 17J80-11]